MIYCLNNSMQPNHDKLKRSVTYAVWKMIVYILSAKALIHDMKSNTLDKLFWSVMENSKVKKPYSSKISETFCLISFHHMMEIIFLIEPKYFLYIYKVT